MKSKIWIIALSILVAILAISTSVLAAQVYQKQYNVSFTVTATPGIKLYSDQAFTTEITTLDFGSISRGATKQITVYMRNVGDTNFDEVILSSDISSSVGTLTFSPNNFALDAGSSATMVFTLKALTTATAQTYSSNIVTIVGSYT